MKRTETTRRSSHEEITRLRQELWETREQLAKSEAGKEKTVAELISQIHQMREQCDTSRVTIQQLEARANEEAVTNSKLRQQLSAVQQERHDSRAAQSSEELARETEKNRMLSGELDETRRHLQECLSKLETTQEETATLKKERDSLAQQLHEQSTKTPPAAIDTTSTDVSLLQETITEARKEIQQIRQNSHERETKLHQHFGGLLQGQKHQLAETTQALKHARHLLQLKCPYQYAEQGGGMTGSPDRASSCKESPETMSPPLRPSNDTMPALQQALSDAQALMKDIQGAKEDRPLQHQDPSLFTSLPPPMAGATEAIAEDA